MKTEHKIDARGRAMKARARSFGGTNPPRSNRTARVMDGVASMFRLAVSNDAARFLVAGSFAAAVSWLVRFPLSMIMPFGAAVACAFFIGMGVGFGLYRIWVFPGSHLPLKTQIGRFLAVNAAGALVVFLGSIGLLRLLTGASMQLATAEALAHGIAIGLGAVVNFFGHRALTFARSGRGDSRK